MKIPRQVCPRCGALGSGTYTKAVRAKGRSYRYLYFAHRLNDGRLKWCYAGKPQPTSKSTARNGLLTSLMTRYVDCTTRIFGERLASVAIFGSVGRNEARFPESDIDILLVVNGMEGRSIGRRIELAIETEKLLSITPEYKRFTASHGRPSFQEHILTPEELRRHPPILLDLVTDAQILFDKGELREELKRLAKRLRELGARKVRLPDKSWYWRLKEGLKPGEEVVV